MKVEIHINKDKGGIELSFAEKPAENILLRLKEAGFSYSRALNHWWVIYSEPLEKFAIALQEALKNGKEHFQVNIEPSYAASEENIDLKNFSFISVSLTGDDKKLLIDNYIVFEPKKNIASLIAKDFFEKKYGSLLKHIKIYPRNYLKKARALYHRQKIVSAIGGEKEKMEATENTAKEITDAKNKNQQQIAVEKKEKELITENKIVEKENMGSLLEDEKPERQLAETIVEAIEEENFPSQKNNNKSGALQLNQEIEDFIVTTDNEGRGRYSEQDKQYILQYTGSGGLIKQGAEGKGILYEYYTPDEVVKKMWGLAYKYGYNGGSVLEPACGTGRFLKYVPAEAKAEAYEINPTAVRIVEIVYPQIIVHQQPFETIFFAGNIHLKGNYGGKKFDLIIGNPPYGDFSGKWAGMGEKKYTGALEYDQYFMLRGLEMLNPGGLMVFIIPSSFLQNASKYNKVKEKMTELATLIDAYRLPSKMFTTTDIGTDIIVLKRN